jgi:hypothetical protein
VVDAVMFEPGAWRPAQCDGARREWEESIPAVASSNSGGDRGDGDFKGEFSRLSTPCGLLFNELQNAPVPVTQVRP